MADAAALAARQRVKALDAERSAIEADIARLVTQLGPAGMTSPLVDGEAGFCCRHFLALHTRHSLDP